MSKEGNKRYELSTNFSPHRRPYENIPVQHKPIAWGNIIILALLLVAFLAGVWTCAGRVFRAPDITRTLSPVEKAEHDRLLRRHGLEDFSVVLVKDDGKFFVRDGNLNKFR